MAFNGAPQGAVNSDPIQTKVGTSQTNIFTATSTKVTQGSDGKVNGGKTTLYYSPTSNNFVPAATTTDGGKTWTYLKDSNGKEILGANAKTSLERGALKNNTQQQITSASTKAGIPKEQQKELATQTKNNAPTAAGKDQPGVSQESLSQELKTETDNTRNSFSQVLKYPRTLKSEHQDVIKFKMVQYRPRPLSTGGDLNPIQDRPPQKIIGIVTLPIPSGISDTNTATWNSDDLNPLKAMGVDIAQTGITQGLGAAADKAGQAAGAVQGNSKTVQQLITSAFTEAAVGTQNLLSRTQGAVINPNMELLFVGPSLRPFTFTFKLSARSKEEAKDIRSIIRFFKQGMSPIRTKANLFLKAPHTFQLEYLHRNKPHTYLNKFKECALQSFTVDYTPEGQYATFSDGAMVSYQITMQFQELEPIFNDDYGNAENKQDSEIGY